MAEFRCGVHGCKAQVIGMDDLPIESVLKVFPWWTWTGRFLLCEKHGSGAASESDVLWQWRDESGNAANVTRGGVLHSHGDLQAVACALAAAYAAEVSK